MNPISETTLSEIESRCAAATAGPWVSFIEGRDHDSGSNVITTAGEDIELNVSEPDQDFIAHARQDVPILLAEIQRLKQKLAFHGIVDEVCEGAESTDELGYEFDVPEDFHNELWETKGHFTGFLRIEQQTFELYFYDLCRFTQEVEDDFDRRGFHFCDNTFLVPKVTPENLKKCVAHVVDGGLYKWMVPTKVQK